ncbi:MAG: hypothetical protein ACK4S6_18845 [Roseateles asaccharophilus]|uniref:hypothetical protein n=1 Tax=Roseateles asaccharophilus TaxID=582607 RepID=UPI00391C479D
MGQGLKTEAAEAGRLCPMDYRYRPEDIAAAPTLPALQQLDALWVVGGLYGNREALDALLGAYRADPARRKALVFNGDFHWFDAEPAWFAEIQAEVDCHLATRGNVETELARESIGAAGCGCAYPEEVSEATVQHSNRIIERLHAVLPEAQRRRLADLPRFVRAEVAGLAVAIVHGDAHSLAGWNFSREALQSAQARQAAQAACDAAQVRVFASSHTCLPVVSDLGGGQHWVINNGAAGMPNAPGALHGLCTRIAGTAPKEAIEHRHSGALHLSLQAIHYDQDAWWRRFERCWPPGSDAHESYAARMRQGPLLCASR